jgi:hypothetical protein
MLRLCSTILLLTMGAAMAAQGDRRLDTMPRRQMVTPNGQIRSTQDGPTQLEIGIKMWRNMFGDAPLPDHIVRKYNVSPDAR